MLGTKVCGLRSYSGNQLDWIWTMIRCPGRKTWFAVGRTKRYISGLSAAIGFGRLQALAVSATENVGRHHQLITPHRRLARHFVGIHVNHLDHPIGVGAAGRSDQIGDRLPTYFHWRAQYIRDESQDIRTAGRLTLVVHKPLRPRVTVSVADGLNGAYAEGYGLSGVRDIFIERCIARLRRSEAQLQTGGEIERGWPDRAAAGAAGGPRGKAPPHVRSGFKRSGGCDVGFGRTIFEVLIQKRPQDVLTEIKSGVAIES